MKSIADEIKTYKLPIATFFTFIVTLFISSNKYLLFSSTDFNFSLDLGKIFLQVIIYIVVSFIVAVILYKIDKWDSISCTPDNFCKAYFCEYLHQMFITSDKSSLLFTYDNINNFQLNECLGGKSSHQINKVEHNITSQRDYNEYTKACEIVSAKAKRTIVMTYPRTPFYQKNADPEIIQKISNACKSKISITKYIYISPSEIDSFCNQILDEYNTCVKYNHIYSSKKSKLKEHFIFQYIHAHNKLKDFKWIFEKNDNEFFTADDNIGLIWDYKTKCMKIELRKNGFELHLPKTSGLDSKKFFKKHILNKVIELNGGKNKVFQKEIEYCLCTINPFSAWFIR